MKQEWRVLDGQHVQIQITGQSVLKQGDYNSGKPGKLRECCNSGKLREF